MSKIVKFESEYGTIFVEVEGKKAGTRDFNSSKSTTEEAKKKFGESLEVLKHVSNTVISKLNDVKEGLRPDEIEVKIGLTFSAEVGALIAKSSTEGNLEVTIKWNAPQGVV